jgi:hypothetical protein
MTPIDPTTPIAVTLQAQEWNQVMHWLGKQPYEAVAPLITKIGEQAQAAAGQAPQPLANGADSHVRN